MERGKCMVLCVFSTRLQCLVYREKPDLCQRLDSDIFIVAQTESHFQSLILNTQFLYIASDMVRKASGVALVSNRIGKTVGVPRGLLRFLVLKMLSEKPMSGVEIAEHIEKQTGGRWKPSPGSIYPLLAWMRKKGFTREEPKSEEGLKRYSFTESGREFLDKQVALGQDFLNRMEFLLPMLMGGLPFGSDREKLRGAIEPSVQIVNAFTIIRHNIDALSQEDTEEIIQALKEVSKRLDRLVRRFSNENKA